MGDLIRRTRVEWPNVAQNEAPSDIQVTAGRYCVPMTDNDNYRSYLIRFQREAGETHWRVMLQEIQSSKTLRFATERELIRYLLNELQAPMPNDEPNETNI